MANGNLTPEEAIQSEMAFRTYVVHHIANFDARISALEAREAPGLGRSCRLQAHEIDGIRDALDGHRNALIGGMFAVLVAMGTALASIWSR